MSLVRLRGLLLLLFFALAVPSAIILIETQGQLRWESFHHFRGQAEALSGRIDAGLRDAIATEEGRGFGEYAFLVSAGDPALSNLVQRSSLAAFPVRSPVPGLIGYFQVDDEGRFSTPVLPPDEAATNRYGIGAEEWAQRSALQLRLFDLLSSNRLVDARRGGADDEIRESSVLRNAESKRVEESAAGFDLDTTAERRDAGEDEALATALAPERRSVQDASQAAFDRLNAPEQQKLRAAKNELGSVDELQLRKTYQDSIPEPQAQQELRSEQKDAAYRAPRKERAAEFTDLQRQASFGTATRARIRTFESEIDPFEFSVLDAEHAVFYRKVWREGRRITQGFVVDSAAFFEAAFERPFRESTLAPLSDLLIAYQDDVVRITRGADDRYVFSRAESLRGELLYQFRLAEPMGKFQLLFNIRELPVGPGARVIGWSALVLFGVLVLGFYALYRLGARQIVLARQQQDFVSAVSHELKTPLTSIRMYGEMLREGWAGESKRQEYYRFIHEESERLSRLIDNVLQLARLERQGLQLDMRQVPVHSILDMLRSKVQGLTERAGFTVRYENSLDRRATLVADTDALMQIVLNLVENAIKFSAKAERKEIEITAQAEGKSKICLSVRDYGPGIEQGQFRRIFELFYRPGSELTRETTGTGIGLALVRQLARAMHGEADVVNREPGAEFRVILRREELLRRDAPISAD
jgi:signal transduction histidine kinase